MFNLSFVSSNKAKAYFSVASLMSFALYLAGFHILFLLVLVAGIVAFTPMPTIFSTWFSRVVAGVLFFYALAQSAEMLQFLTAPTSKFGYLSAILVVIVLIFIWVFGRVQPFRSIKLAGYKDAAALAMLIPLCLALAPIVTGRNSIQHIAVIASTQISDSVAHFGGISGYVKSQNLHYSPGDYYPSGFHLTTAYLERSMLGDVNESSWQRHVVMYFGQYLVMAALLAMTILYFGLALLEKCLKRPTVADYMSLLLILGIAATPLYLLLFINEGFINYFYICASILLAMLYVIDSEITFNGEQKLAKTLREYSWPLSAFLLLGFGASFSWPLQVLPVLLTGFLVFLPRSIDSVKKDFKVFVVAHIPIAIFVLCNFSALYFQAKYFKNGGQVINYGGGLTSYNVPLLVLGAAAATYIAVTNLGKLANRIGTIVVPQLLLIAAFLAWQMFALGEIRYYVIKSSIPLEMLSLVFLSIAIISFVRRIDVRESTKVLWAVSLTLFIVVGSIALMPHPFQEIRGMFRGTTNLGLPAHTKEDVQLITDLGLSGKIHDFNVTILHYEADNNHLYAHSQPALWANAMTPSYADTSMGISSGRTSNCFGTQYNILAYGTGRSDEQGRLRTAIKDCIQRASDQHQPYYVVTDSPSAAYLKPLLGPGVTYIAK